MEAVAENFATGLVGTLGVTIDDNLGNNVVARTTAGIAEIQTIGAYGVYRYLGVYPATTGVFTITWDDGVVSASEYIEVIAVAPDPSDAALGPCSPWTTALDVAECCGIELGSDTEEALEQAALDASGILFALSGRLYAGACGPVLVRPCSTRNSCFVPWRSNRVRSCGCSGLAEVLLAGYPVTEVVEVKIDGEVQASSEYRLDGSRKLVRLADADGRAQRWPSCQRLDLDDDQDDTWSVSYYHGAAPPALGVSATASLACEIYRACSGTGECALPTGTTRITRQGITIEREKISTFLLGGHTGIVLVDMFLVAYGGKGAARRSAVWSPDGPTYAKRVG